MLHTPQTHGHENTPRVLDRSARADVEGLPIAERMARVMVDTATRGCDRQTLKCAGLTDAEIDANTEAARAIARDLFVRRDDAPAYNRALRVAKAADLILEQLPQMGILTLALQNAGFAKSELDDILPDAMAGAADRFAAEAGAS